MPSFVHSPGRECPWQGRGTRQVLHIPRSAVQEIYTIIMEKTFVLENWDIKMLADKELGFDIIRL